MVRPGETSRWDMEPEMLEIGLFNKINLKLMVTFFLIYMFNTILYFSWTLPDFYQQHKKR
jgi:hypothetical protein